jgi:predicted metal-binding transcription factor (methanogenesis marker protein 9)
MSTHFNPAPNCKNILNSRNSSHQELMEWRESVAEEILIDDWVKE